MLVPSRRLLIYFAVLGIPACTLLGFSGMAIPVALLLLVGLAVVVVDAVLSGRALDGVEVETGGAVRGTKGTDITIPIAIADRRGGARRVQIGIPLPSQFDSEEEQVAVQLPSDPGQVEEEWEVQAVERGEGTVANCYLQGPSPLGLWERREERALDLGFRIYPDLTTEKRALAPLFLRRGSLGAHVLRQMGKGREFEQLRDYLPGDSYEDIYWKATARRGQPVTKVFQIERTQDIYVILDLSRRSGRRLEWEHEAGAAPARTQAERFIQSALVLALAAESQGDRFGLVTFSDRVDNFLRAGGGRGHYGTCRDAIHALDARPVSPDFDELFTELRNRLGRRSLLLFFTDLADPVLAESFAEAVPALSRQHLVVVVTLAVPGVAPVFARGATAEDTPEVYQRLAGHLLWADGEELSKRLGAHGVNIISAGQASLASEAVTAYLNVKRRQVL